MKKTNTFKRALAVFISVLMVISSLPFTAITASAATDPNLLAFYFNNSVSAKSVTTNYAGENAPALGTVSEDTLVWNYTENAAEFKGSKSETARVKLSDLLNGKTCNNSTGFTIQFDAKTNMTGWGNFFEISNSTPYNGTGGTGKTYVYLSASSNSGESYKCHSKVALTNGSESSSACSVAVNDNQWHNFRLVIGQGQLYIFVDGKLQSPGLNDSSRINDNLFNELKNNGYLNFGASAYSQSPAYTGYIRNFMFVNNAKLDIAMAKYENKMNGTVYTNMKPAYEAYVTAKKCAEALRYGDFESYPNIENYADDLNTKTDAMTEFTGYTANEVNAGTKVFVDADNSSQADYNEIYKNVLYAQRGITANSNAALNKSNVYSPDSGFTFDFKFFYPTTTFLYDGKTTPQVGAMFSCYGNKKPGTWGWGNMWLYAAYINNTSDISFDSKWKGRDGRLNHTWVWRTQGTVNISGTGDTTSMYYNQAKRDEFYYANVIKFNKTLTSSDAFLLEYTPSISVRSGYNGSNGKNSKLNDLGAANRKIYVINYKKVVDATKSKSSVLSDVENYTQGGLSSVITALTDLQKNPNDYFSSSNDVNGCKTYFEGKLTALDNATATKDSFFTITAKKDTNTGDTLATFSLSNGCKAKTVQYALNSVTPGNGQAETYHYDYVWTSNTITDVKANATYVATQAKEDHKFIDVDVKTPATCETAGVMNTKCSVCDYASTRVINAAGHIYSDFTKTWDNYVDDSTVYQHKKTCDNTGCETPTVNENCTFGEWVTNDAETEDSRTCSVCGGIQTREHKADQVTINFKRDGDIIVQSFTVDKGETVNAPASFTLYDVDGHHTYSYPQVSYVATENADIQADREDVAHTNVQTRKINLSNVDENGVATSCKEGLTYSYDLQTYCADCNTIISTVNTPVSALAHTETKQANGSRDNHNIYCPACNTVLRTDEHVFTTTDVASTCIAQGYTQSDCECGAQYKDDFKELAPHTFGDYISNNDGTHTRTCSVCQFDQTGTCNYTKVIIPATCTESAKQTSKCNDCGYDADVVNLGNAVEVNTLYDVTYISNGNSNSEKTFTLPDEANYMDVTINSYATDGVFSDSKLYVYGIKTAGGAEEEVYRNSGGNDQLNKTFRVYGNYFRVKTQDFTGTQDYYNIVSVKAVIKKYAAQGHEKHYINNEDAADGLLGTHRNECSVCHEGADEKTEHNFDLQRSGSNIVVSCKDCDFSQVLHTTANTVTVTENNLFDTDKFIRSYNAEGTNTTSHGLACFRRTDGKAVVVGNGDNYTAHDRENDYLIPVEGGKTYQFDFDASTTYGDVMLFYRNAAGTGYDNNYLNMRKSGTAIGKNTIEFTVPEGGKNLYIRIGTNNSGDRNAYCVFSNFALHEKDDPNYRMITDVPSGSAINDILDPINEHATADFCCYKFKNSSISFTDGTIANDKTINRNVNVVADREHNLYKEFRNGTVAHYYCLDCGYATDKIVSPPSLIYRESFDNVTINGTTMTSPTGVNGTLGNEGSVSVVAGAGDTHGNKSSGGAYNGSASEWRTNVLKINKPSTLNNSRGNYIKMNSNPFTNLTAKENAKQNGVTISFWRHLENEDGSLGQVNTKNASEAQWRDIITFMPSSAQSKFESGASTSQYLMINADGCMSITAPGHTGNDNGAYFDYYPAFNDKTSTMATTTSGYWEHIAVTADPISGVTVYINGVPHDATIKSVNNMGAAYYKNGNVNDGDVAKAIVDWVTSDDMVYSLANGNYWNTSDMVTYIDDIRFYDGAMTQLEVNQMYGDSNSDTPVKTSTSHDPTTVIVYTLSNGKTVGQEYIDYYDAASDVVDVWYYSFGTGMTVYKSHDNINWELVGDKKGNFGYQNQDLFGGDYLTVLAEYEKFVKDNMSGQAGAGYLVWAPHVMYNLELDRWTYYAACSVWAGAVAVQFMMSSTDGNIEHYDPSTLTKVKQSYNKRPNVIDACVFYEYDKDTSKPIKDSLWITYGAWCDSNNTNDIMIDKLDADGTINSSTGSAYDKRLWNDQGGQAIVNGLTTTKNEHTGEGSFVRYENGYYYIYVAYGTNEGDYTTRVFRSETPNGEYVDVTGRKALVTSNDKGLQVMNSYYLPAEDYMYVSTGHNSIYTAVNNNGENVTINTLHARPYVNDATGWNAIPEQAMVTRQTGLTGNVTLINPVFYTQENWPVIMPLQYNGTDTSTVTLTSTDIVGEYYYNVMTDSVDYNVSNPQQLEITACIESEAFITFADGTVQKVNIINENGKTYFANDDIKGVFAKQGDTVEFSFISGNHQTWGYQTASGTVSHVYGEYTVTTPATCLANAIEEAKCSKCNGTDSREVANSKLEHSYTGESVHIDADGDNNGYTEHRCVNGCNELGGRVYDELDWSAYDSILEVVEYNKTRTDMYTADSIADYTNYVNAITTNVDKTDVTKSQAYIDDQVDAIDDCKKYLKLESYTVTFEYQIDGESTKVIDEKQFEYGKEIPMEVPEDVEGKVYKWTYAIGNADVIKRSIDNRSITYIVAASNATIIAYVDSGSSTVTGHSVKMYSKTGKLSDSQVVANNYKLNINELNIATIAFYNITGYRVNGNVVNLTDAENYTVTEDLEIQPIYSVRQDETVDGVFVITGEGITINGKQNTYNTVWDAKVTATAPDTNANTAWYVNGELVGYGASYTFRATKSCTVRYENAQEVAGVSSLDFLDYGVYRNHGITVVGHYDVPEGATDVKYGVILKTVKNPTDTTRKLTFAEITEGNTTGKKYATTLTDTDQYKIVVTRTANTPILIGAVAFVEYTINGESKVAYSAPQTIYGVN